MKNPRLEYGAPAADSDGELVLLEMRVAQRADELWQNEGCARGRDLEYWLQAEREICASQFGPPREAAPAG
jgi:hypothetical protein